MEWLDKMNDALSYIEANLAGKINYAEVASAACSSLTRLQKMFIFMTDLTLSDYVRYRKMSLAAEELIHSGIRILDLAHKYGYDSPEAFTRAFQSFHGTPPSIVRKLKVARSFQPISLEIKISGGSVMSESGTIVHIEELKDVKVVSFTANCEGPETPAWYALREWAAKNLSDYNARRFIGFASGGHHPNGEDSNLHEYEAQMILYGDEGNAQTFLGVRVTDAPSGLFLVGDVSLNEYQEDGTVDIGMSMQKSSQVIYECMQKMGGYEIDFNGRTFLEEHIFPEQWFTTDKPEQISPQLKFWLPIKKV